MAKGICTECNSSFRGRADKKFCSDNCRSQYNNRRYRKNNPMKKINKILRRNYRILKRLACQIKKETVPREYLAMEGFLFDYCTHIKQNGEKEIKYCYDYGFYKKPDGTIKIQEETQDF